MDRQDEARRPSILSILSIHVCERCLPLTPQEFLFELGQGDVQKHGTAMRAGEGHVAACQIVHQSAHFLVLQALAGADGSMTGSDRQQAVEEPWQALFEHVFDVG